ncbi:MAG TPA: hypothetical protein VM869_11300 [Enhygromyxa sp.]|nr:hypothetical protein [Enhygromyxa sp.]
MDARDERQATLGIGNYRARRVGDIIVLHASGDTPTPNYKSWLRRAPNKELADYELWWLPPADTSLELSTPFSVNISFRAEPDADRVRVRDAAGVHDVGVEGTAEPAAPTTTALVYLHHANQFDLRYRGKDISFTQANIAGDPLLTYDQRYFYGRQIELQDTAIGELVTVTLEERPNGDRWRMTVVLPRTWVSGYESSLVEALVIESVTRGLVEGPPAGQELELERVTQVGGHATFVVS